MGSKHIRPHTRRHELRQTVEPREHVGCWANLKQQLAPHRTWKRNASKADCAAPPSGCAPNVSVEVPDAFCITWHKHNFTRTFTSVEHSSKTNRTVLYAYARGLNMGIRPPTPLHLKTWPHFTRDLLCPARPALPSLGYCAAPPVCSICFPCYIVHLYRLAGLLCLAPLKCCAGGPPAAPAVQVLDKSRAGGALHDGVFLVVWHRLR